MEEQQIFRFGVFEFDAASNALQRAGRSIPLQPQASGLLHLLVLHAGVTISRERIKEALWNDDVNVDFEMGINRCVRDLRMALHDDALNPTFIRTIAKRGYRFLAPVSTVESIADSTVPAKSPEFIPPEPFSLVVLPFVSFGGDPTDEYFCDGLTEEVINVLTQISNLLVIARTSAFAFKGRNEDVRAIGKKLGVSYVVEGSVRRAGSKVRVTVQLIRAADGMHCLSKRYDHDWADLFAIQDEIANDVAHQLRLQLRLHYIYEPKFDSYEAFLEGRHHFFRFSAEGFQKALKCFERAVDLDPNYARPLNGIAIYWTAVALEYVGKPIDLLSRARVAAVRAVALDETDPEAHGALATASALLDYDWAAADKHFRRANELGRQSVIRIYYAYWFLLPRGELAEALIVSDQLLKTDPLLLIGHCLKASVLFSMRDYAASAAASLRALEVDPEFTQALRLLALAKLQQGSLREAESLALRLIELKGPTPVGLDTLGIVRAAAGDRSGAHEIIRELMNSPAGQNGPSLPASIYAALGEYEDAFDCQERAVEVRDPRALWTRNLPWFDQARSAPRYISLMRAMGLS